MTEPDAQEISQREIRKDAAEAEDDPVTSREALETELMAEGDSDAGEEIGEPTP